MVCRGSGSSAANANTLVLQLKYWCLYAILFGAIPTGLTRALLANLPLAGLAVLAASAAITAELLRDFTRFAQNQDTRFVFLFNKLGDANTSWWQWFQYAGAYDENNTARLFVFGQFTQLCVSVTARLPLGTTSLLDNTFDALQEWLVRLAHFAGQHWSQRNVGTSPPTPGSTKYAEGYDMLEDFLDDSKKSLKS